MPHYLGPLSRPFFRKQLLLAASSFAAVTLGAQQSPAQEVEALKAQLAAIQNRLAALESQPPPAPAAPSSNVSVQVNRRGLVVEATDKSFNIRIRPRIQVDGNFFPDDDDGTNGFTLRRVRPVIQGVAGPVSWRFMPELAGTVRIIDAWGELELTDGLSLQAGKFKGPVGYERLQSFSKTLFIERGLPSVLTATREIGLQLNGAAFDDVVSWNLGVYNGTLDDTDQSNNANLSDGFDVAAGLSLRPFAHAEDSVFQGLTVGVAGSIGDENVTIADSDRDARIRYRTSGRNTFFRYADGALIDGDHTRLNAYASWYYGPVGVLTEWVRSSYDLTRGGVGQSVDSDGFTFQVGWVVTGEKASYEGVRPKNPFNPADGHWGAFELGLRYHTLEVGDEAFSGDATTRLARNGSAQKAEGYGAVLNWTLTDNTLIALAYEVTDFSGQGADRSTEQVIQTRFQLDF
ncbi:MAG: porin [Verrucomicrobiota bacterium JB022]|nr:porin [Verrucomicrobiota bacterium JB022]